ncbi:MAG: copper-binding protein [Burkholderiaceae bacterium]|nr:copper-binding protein [Burkholderiaceae bacterium]MDZ4146500.1 copper-binding protein [Burkholderiales bacterium]
MKKIQTTLAATAILLTLWATVPAFAQTPMVQGKAGMSQAPAMTDGEVRKVDKEAGKITLRHGDIKHMDMPGMTMVFVAKDKSMLDKVQVGDKVRFMVMDDQGKMVVTDIQPAR